MAESSGNKTRRLRVLAAFPTQLGGQPEGKLPLEAPARRCLGGGFDALRNKVRQSLN